MQLMSGAHSLRLSLCKHMIVITRTTLLVVNAFTTNTSWTQAVRFESLML